jgi:hypothetical protein
MSINRDIEKVYVKLEKSFFALDGFMDDDLSGLFKMCRLKPYRIFTGGKYRWETRVHRHWIDEYGCSVRIEKKKLVVLMNDLDVDRKWLHCTDLYGGLGVSRTSLISKMGFGNEKLVGLLGLDGYLRVFVRLDKWVDCSPLMFGIEGLKLIWSLRDVKHVQKIGNEWVFGMPISKEMIDSLEDDARFMKEIIDDSK